jgi:hypothetical protein
VADGNQGAYYWNGSVVPPGDGFSTIVPAGSAQGGWSRLQKAITTVQATTSPTILVPAPALPLAPVTAVALSIPTTGAWLISGTVQIALPTSGTLTTIQTGLSLFPTTYGYMIADLAGISVAGPATVTLAAPILVLNLAAGSTVYLGVTANWSGAQPTAGGMLQATLLSS